MTFATPGAWAGNNGKTADFTVVGDPDMAAAGSVTVHSYHHPHRPHHYVRPLLALPCHGSTRLWHGGWLLQFAMKAMARC